MITYETNEYDEQVIVNTTGGTVIKELDRPAPLNSIPQVVSMRQARLALLQAGMLSTVDEVIAGITPVEAQQRIKVEWDYATEVARNWPTLLALQPALGLTDAQVDDLFVLASQL
jgi:hypothetical protein